MSNAKKELINIIEKLFRNGEKMIFKHSAKISSFCNYKILNLICHLVSVSTNRFQSFRVLFIIMLFLVKYAQRGFFSIITFGYC